MKHLSGKTMPENKTRNKALIKKREEGYSFNRLGQIFNISPQRANELYKKHLKREERGITAKEEGIIAKK